MPRRGRQRGRGHGSRSAGAGRRRPGRISCTRRSYITVTKLCQVSICPWPTMLLGATRIIEPEDARLHDRTGGAEARRMVGFALDFDRARHLVRDHDAGRIPFLRRLPSRNSARRPGTIPGGWTTYGRSWRGLVSGPQAEKAAERHRGRHQLQKPAALQHAQYVAGSAAPRARRSRRSPGSPPALRGCANSRATRRSSVTTEQSSSVSG